MRDRVLIVIIIIFLCNTLNVNAQYTDEETIHNRCFLGSSAFMLFNLAPEETPDFYQLNLGYRLTKKDIIALEFKTWRYFKPIGIPYGKAKSDPLENFPGYVREKGFALVYQRFLFDGFYTSVHVMSAWQNFIGDSGNEIDKGFQIFNTYRVGYHLKLFNKQFFIEPSIAITHRAYHTEMPEAFSVMDNKWPKFFFGEPGLHVGFNF